MNLKLKVWRQKDRVAQGEMVDIEAHDIPGEASFLEMLDIVEYTRTLADELSDHITDFSLGGLEALAARRARGRRAR